MSETTTAPPDGGAPPAEPAATGGLLTQGGGEDPRAWLPEAYRNDPTFADLRDLDGLAKSYKHAATLVGADRAQVLRLPKAPDAPEWEDVWNRLGRPEKPDGYALATPDGTPPETLTALADVFHKAGMTKQQADAVMGWYGERVQAAMTERSQRAEIGAQEAVRLLKQEWGAAYDDQVHAARQAVREYGGEAFTKLLDETGLHSHPAVVRMMARIGASLAEPGGLKGGGNGQATGGPVTPAAAVQEIARLRGDRQFTADLMARTAPGHQAARERWDNLHRMAYPEIPA